VGELAIWRKAFQMEEQEVSNTPWLMNDCILLCPAGNKVANRFECNMRMF
jgi:hypothetical protein